jgi:cyanophycinase
MKLDFKLFIGVAVSCILLFYSFPSTAQKIQPKGKLFIIGGGEKPKSLMDEMLKTANIKTKDYIIVLPMSSEEPDTAVLYAKEDFATCGYNHVVGMNIRNDSDLNTARLDSIAGAKLIYISGGDQTRFMGIVGTGKVFEAIHKAYQSGATIAGTSAGAAVMSKKMLTGNSIRYPDYTGNFPTIEHSNIEIAVGLGLVEGVIIDQHFIKRQRMNRLIAACLENPGNIGIGIDESTAIVVSGKNIRVVGENQVVVIRNLKNSKQKKGNLLGGKGLIVDILLPGDKFGI